MMKLIYFVLLTALIFSTIGKASSVASPTIVTTSGKLIGIHNGAGGMCIIRSTLKVR